MALADACRFRSGRLDRGVIDGVLSSREPCRGPRFWANASESAKIRMAGAGIPFTAERG